MKAMLTFPGFRTVVKTFLSLNATSRNVPSGEVGNSSVIIAEGSVPSLEGALPCSS